MGTGIVIIRKQLEGQEWDNTWGVTVGPTSGVMTLADLESLVGTLPVAGLTDETTYHDNPGYGGATSIIAAILSFERAMHYQNVVFTHVAINDGPTPGDDTGVFWSQAVNFNGKREGGTSIPSVSIAPLNVALLINRNPAALSVKPGRLYLRAVLRDIDIKPGSRVGVTWENSTQSADVTTSFNAIVTASLITTYMASPSTEMPSIHLAVPHYSKIPAEKRKVVSGSPIGSLSVGAPVSRQMTRGRRRRPVTA